MTIPRGPGRPPVTSRDKIENVALQLFFDCGYENTTVHDIVAACGISKSSFFRYFRSKSDILWDAFDAHLERLRENLQKQPELLPITDGVVDGVIETFAVDIDPEGLWLRRFRLQEEIDRGAPRSLHWMMWADVISKYVRERTDLTDTSLVPEAIGGAIQGALLAFIQMQKIDNDWQPADTLQDFRARLEELAAGMQNWIDTATR